MSTISCNKRNNRKYTNQIFSFPDDGTGTAGAPTSETARQVPESPGLDSPADGNRIQECRDQDWGQRQKNRQTPPQTPAMKGERPS